MFEKLRIKEHMEVADCKGIHVGTVDEVEGDAIKLTKSDSSDDIHHFLSMDDVEKIDDNRIYLKESARIPAGLGTKAAERADPAHSDPVSGSDEAPPGFCRSGAFLWDGSKIEPNHCAQAVFG